MSIQIETTATVTIPDTGCLEADAYAAALDELTAARPLDVPSFLRESYDRGNYQYDFRLTTPNAV